MTNNAPGALPIGWRPQITLADRLRATRRGYAKQLGYRITIEQFAEMVDVGHKAYGAYEAGINEPKPDDLWDFALRVARVTGVDPRWLAGGGAPTPPPSRRSSYVVGRRFGWNGEHAGQDLLKAA